MRIKSKFLGLAGATSALVSLVQITGCTTDDSPLGSGGAAGAVASAGAGGSTTGTAGNPGASGSGTGGSSGAGTTVCANPILIPSTKPAIADFETYDGVTSFATWFFSLGGDSSSGAIAGTFAFGDRPDGFPETSEVSAGHDSLYAMRIADSDPSRAPGASGLYGGGVGLWQSACLNATQFTGITFWVRGSSPSPNVTLTISMKETLPSTPTKPMGDVGTCMGTGTMCAHPTFAFPVTDTWTQIHAPWSGFKLGDAVGTPVTPDGRNITQLQFGVGLVFVPADGSTVYVAIPAAYELAVDDIAFY